MWPCVNMCVWMRVPMEVTESSDPLEMELQAVVSHMGAGDQSRFCGRAASTLNLLKHLSSPLCVSLCPSVCVSLCVSLFTFQCLCVHIVVGEVCHFVYGFQKGARFTRLEWLSHLHWSGDVTLFFNEWVFFKYLSVCIELCVSIFIL